MSWADLPFVLGLLLAGAGATLVAALTVLVRIDEPALDDLRLRVAAGFAGGLAASAAGLAMLAWPGPAAVVVVTVLAVAAFIYFT